MTSIEMKISYNLSFKQPTLQPSLPAQPKVVTEQDFDQALALHQQGSLAEAKKMYESILKLNPRHAGCWHFLGLMALQSNRLEMAVKYINESLKNDPNDAAPYVNLGLAFKGLDKLPEAIASYDKAIQLSPTFVEAHINRGVALAAAGRLSEAVSDCDQAIALSPGFAQAHFVRAGAMAGLNRADEALGAFDKALAIEPQYHEAILGRGRVLLAQGRAGDAVADFDKVIALRPGLAEAHSNRGVALMELKRTEEALASFDKAIACDPASAEAHYNLGKALEDINRLDQALFEYDQVIELKPDHADAHSNRSLILFRLKRYEQAIEGYEQMMRVCPDYKFGVGASRFARMTVCDWSGFDADVKEIQDGIRAGVNICMPFVYLALGDSPELQKLVAQDYRRAELAAIDSLGPIPRKAQSGKVRIAYYSADFREHPVSHLMVGAFEAHDRSKFELFAFAFGPGVRDAMRTRVSAAFDRFIDVTDMSDRDVAEQSRALGIDIAINLGGFTEYERTGIFAHRCAPVQANYLGYSGTMGVDYMDYIFVDQTLVPTDMRPQYVEKVACLPDSYLVYGSPPAGRAVAPARATLGLPDAAFVFCCFNNSYKILPAVFASWMRILHSVPNSVLWLSEANSSMADNLRKEAQAHGVDEARLVFAGRAPREVYLANFSQADLFLDTAPHNACTTAADALWAGLPVLTRMGQTFVARMAASLLTTAGLPELITCTVEDYEARAIELATHPVQLAALKARLQGGHATNPLFDIPRFTRHLESAYQTMHDRSLSGLAPASFEVLQLPPT